jgi:hypothetical protein
MFDFMRERTKQKKTVSAPRGGDKSKYERTLGNDYWNRVANDVASGYKSIEDEDNILNIDQEPGDHEPGDKNT